MVRHEQQCVLEEARDRLDSPSLVADVQYESGELTGGFYVYILHSLPGVI